jgi:hypothetical protein
MLLKVKSQQDFRQKTSQRMWHNDQYQSQDNFYDRHYSKTKSMDKARPKVSFFVKE